MEQQFLQNIAEALFREDEIKLEDDFRQYEEWDSMAALSMIAMIDEQYQVKVSGDDIRSCVTLGDILKLISERV